MPLSKVKIIRFFFIHNLLGTVNKRENRISFVNGGVPYREVSEHPLFLYSSGDIPTSRLKALLK